MTIKKTLAVFATAALISGFYIGVKESGFVQEFNNAIHCQDGWKKEDNGWSKTKIITEHYVSYSLLKDPETENVRVLRGAIKKKALDRMNLVYTGFLKLEKKNEMEKKLKKIAKKKNCTIVAINNTSTLTKTETKAFGYMGK